MPAPTRRPTSQPYTKPTAPIPEYTTRPGREQGSRTPLALDRYEILDTTGVAGLASLLGSG